MACLRWRRKPPFMTARWAQLQTMDSNNRVEPSNSRHSYRHISNYMLKPLTHGYIMFHASVSADFRAMYAIGYPNFMQFSRSGGGVRSLFGHFARIEGLDCFRLRIGASRSSVYRAKPYDIFGKGPPGDEAYRKAWEKEVDEATCCWTGSDSEDEELRSKALKDYYDLTDSEGENGGEGKKKDDIFSEVKEGNSEDIDGDKSDELRSVWSGSDEEKTLWSGSEDDDDDDIPVTARPHEKSDRYLDQIFEFEEAPRLRTLSELTKGGGKREKISPGTQARKLAMQNALKKLKKGPDGRYTNVVEVMTDLDVLIASFEKIISGPEYADLRAGGPKKLNMQFFKDIQERMRNGTYEFTPELKLKPKSRFVSKKKYLRAMARERKRR